MNITQIEKSALVLSKKLTALGYEVYVDAV